MKQSFLVIIIFLFSACYPLTVVENSPSPTTNNIQVTATSTLQPSQTPSLELSNTIQILNYQIYIGEIECSLEPFTQELSNWYLVICPEEVWFPISQIKLIEVNPEKDNSNLKPAEDIGPIIQHHFPDAQPIEFVQMEDGQWGCEVPYSDTAGTVVMCTFKEKDNIFVIQGKTARIQSAVNNNSTSLGGSNESCFLPGTRILTCERSYKNIEDIYIGDEIATFDEITKKTGCGKVLEIENPVRNVFYEIHLVDGTILQITSEHPIFIKKENYEGWAAINPIATFHDSKIKVENLDFQSLVLKFDYRNHEINWVQIHVINKINKLVQTYNLSSIEGNHTFFAEDIIVHNKGGWDDDGGEQ